MGSLISFTIFVWKHCFNVKNVADCKLSFCCFVPFCSTGSWAQGVLNYRFILFGQSLANLATLIWNLESSHLTVLTEWGYKYVPPRLMACKFYAFSLSNWETFDNALNLFIMNNYQVLSNDFSISFMTNNCFCFSSLLMRHTIKAGARCWTKFIIMR